MSFLILTSSPVNTSRVELVDYVHATAGPPGFVPLSSLAPILALSVLSAVSIVSAFSAFLTFSSLSYLSTLSITFATLGLNHSLLLLGEGSGIKIYERRFRVASRASIRWGSSLRRIGLGRSTRTLRSTGLESFFLGPRWAVTANSRRWHILSAPRAWRAWRAFHRATRSRRGRSVASGLIVESQGVLISNKLVDRASDHALRRAGGVKESVLSGQPQRRG